MNEERSKKLTALLYDCKKALSSGEVAASHIVIYPLVARQCRAMQSRIDEFIAEGKKQ